MFHKRQFWGAILLFLGVIFLLGNLDIFDYSLRQIFKGLWPMVLIIIGIGLIIRHSRNRERTVSIEIDGTGSTARDSYHENFRLFGDHNIDSRDREINGLDYSTVFGDTKLNLSGARLKSGDNNIFISTTFGDITVIAPHGMAIKAHGSTTFGDIYILDQSTSGIPCKLTRQTDNYDTATEKVFIRISAIFGSIKIYQA